MVSFPLLKLSLLALKHISKPVVKGIKDTAKFNEPLRKYLVAPTAQTYHWIGVRTKMRILGMNQPKFVPPLNNTLAIQIGSELLGELIIFIIAVSFLILEFSRQKHKDALKHQQHREEKIKLKKELEILNDRVLCQTHEIIRLKARVVDLTSSHEN
ncbi:putative OPA3-like protein CG13603 [Drosophila hydei]|uniref:OPA3-like protein CG13603 n=1 Tax=Drosophila hydei TaxID=7224 RepID=A0A6J1MCZ2_DROHY|nr:putative OPA3-like protein CG13603 [Drosophila hydei]